MIVDLPEATALLRPQVRIGREVVNLATIADRSPHCDGIANVARYEVDAIQRQMLDIRAGTFENPHGFARIE